MKQWCIFQSMSDLMKYGSYEFEWNWQPRNAHHFEPNKTEYMWRTGDCFHLTQHVWSQAKGVLKIPFAPTVFYLISSLSWLRVESWEYLKGWCLSPALQVWFSGCVGSRIFRSFTGDLNAFSSFKSTAHLISKELLCNGSGQTPGNHTRIFFPCSSWISPFFISSASP